MEILTYPGLKPIDWIRPPKATDRVSSDYICSDGVRFTGSFRTVAHMAWLMDQARAQRLTLQVIQPPFHTGLGISEGTHDKDACSDVRIIGLSWWDGQTWLRRRGFDCWWRHTGDWASPADWHFHGFTHPAAGITFATTVGLYVDGGVSQFGHLVSSSQIVDYSNHAYGLEGQHIPGSDHSWFPPDPHAVAFNLNAYVKNIQEELMEYKDWSAASKQELAGDIAALLVKSNNDLLGREVTIRTPDGSGTQKVSLRQAWVRAANGPSVARVQAQRAVDALSGGDSANK